MQRRLESAGTAQADLNRIEVLLENGPDYALPEPPKLMSAKNYRERFVLPLVQRLKAFVRTVLVSCLKAWDKVALLRGENEELEKEKRRLEKVISSLEKRPMNFTNKHATTLFSAEFSETPMLTNSYSKQAQRNKNPMNNPKNERRNAMNNNTNTFPETVFDESNGLTYDLVGDVYLPRLSISEKPEDIGRFGRQRKRFLKEQKPDVYMELAFNDSLNEHLVGINQEAKEQIELLTEQFAKAEGVTEALKAQDQMLWVQRMSNIRDRATEIMSQNLIYE